MQASPPVFIDAVVIGAGQSGLAAAYYLQQQQAAFMVLDERPAVGDVWATRYQALRLYSPAWASSLPGLGWPAGASYYPTKDEAARYLRQYAAHFQLPVVANQRVIRVEAVAGGFAVLTAAGGCYLVRRVVVCTGPYTAPSIPGFSAALPASVQQFHSSQYQKPGQLPAGPVAVVGSGNSALQIAADLATSPRPVYVAFDEQTPAVPNNTATWLALLGTGLLKVPGHTWLGQYMRRQKEPVVRADLRRLQRMPNVHFIGRAVSATPEGGLAGRRATTPPLQGVVWATGYRPDYAWLQVPGALTAEGIPRHFRGISPVPGLAFLGLDWLHTRRSALMGGAAADARYVVEQLLKRHNYAETTTHQSGLL
jgi:putative flavoprotein involved in K+ transport